MKTHHHRDFNMAEQKPQAPAQEVPREAQPYSGPPIEGRPETYPPNLFSGTQRRLHFEGGDPNFEYHYFNDEGPNVPNALRVGYIFVEKGEVQILESAAPLNMDVGNRICQQVGVTASGNPLYAYLMKIPLWLFKHNQTGPGSREEYHKQLESQIRSGTFAEKPGEMRYSASNPYPGSQGQLPRISVHKTNR